MPLVLGDQDSRGGILSVSCDMPVGVGAGTNVGGAYILWATKSVESKELNCLCINENLYFLRISCFNLRNQTKPQDLPVLKSKKF